MKDVKKALSLLMLFLLVVILVVFLTNPYLSGIANETVRVWHLWLAVMLLIMKK